MSRFRQNPDKDYVKEIRSRLKENNNYCPCKTEKNEDTKCPCKEFLEMESGMCHCGLFIKEAD